MGGSSVTSPIRVGSTRGGGTFVIPPRTGRLFEFSPTGRIGAIVLLSCVASAGLMAAAERAFSPTPPPSREEEFVRKAEALGPVAQRICAEPIFLNPMRNGIPGYTPTPADARRA